MNEEDTFNKLKQTPFKIVRQLILDMPTSWLLEVAELHDNGEGEIKLAEFLLGHGWTIVEWNNAQRE